MFNIFKLLLSKIEKITLELHLILSKTLLINLRAY